MNNRNSKAGIVLAIITILLGSIACNLTRTGIKVGPLKTESQSIERDDAESVRADIEMGAGVLDVSGGANELLQADFTYNVAEMKPEVSYSGGTVSVLTPDIEGVTSFWDMDDYRHDWDLRFNNDVPMEMMIFLGAGQADLDLGGLSLTRLDVDTGAGDITLDLSGTSSLTWLGVNLGAGKVTIDLTGDWQNNLDASIQGGLGEMTLLLPRDVCVRVGLEGGISNTNTTGLTKDGDGYVNDVCGGSAVTLHIDIKAGIGEINLELGD
jgi:hypothetical protein